MAQDISIASVYIDDHQAGQKLKELATEADKLALKMNKLRKANDKAGYDKARKEWRAATKELTIHKRTVVDVTKVLNNLSGHSQKQLIKTQKILRNEVVKMNRSTKEELALYNTKVAQLKRVDAELSKVRMEMKSLNATQQSWLSRSAGAFNKYSMMIGGVMASLFGMVMAFRKAIGASDDFEVALDGLAALTGLGGDELNYLAEQAKKLSVTTDESGVRITQSAADILNAYKRMGSARPELLQDKEALAEVTKNAIILSEAATMELVPATNALATALNQFNASAEDSARYMNAMGAGSKYGAGNIEYIAKALEKSGTSAKMAGMEIEETIAIIETIAPKFAEPSIAGTQLRNIFIRLQVGADAFNPKIVGMTNALDNLAKANLSTAEKVKLFGLRNINAAETLITYRKQMSHFKEILTNTNIATEQAIINTDNHASKIEQAKNKLNLVSIELGEHLAPAMTFSTNAASYLIKGTLKLIKTLYKYRVVILSATAAIVAYNLYVNASAIKLRLFTIATNIATKATKAFNWAMKSNPIGLLIGLLAAAATTFFLFRKKADEATTAQKEFNDEIERGKDLLKDNKSLNDRFKLIYKMSATQIKRFKEDVKLQVAEVDLLNEKKLLAEQKYIEESAKLNEWINQASEEGNARYYRQHNESMKKDMLAAQRYFVLLSQQVENANAKQLQSYIEFADDRLKLLGEGQYTNVDLLDADDSSKKKFDPANIGSKELASILSLNKQKRAAFQDQRNQDIIDLKKAFDDQSRERQIAHNQELVALGTNENAKKQLQDQFRKEELTKQLAFLQQVIDRSQEIIATGGVNGLSLEDALLSDEDKEALLEKIEELKLKISELNVDLIPDPDNKTDILGMSQEDWDTFQMNMQLAFDIVGTMGAIWANMNQSITNQETAAFDHYKVGVEKKIQLLNKQKEAGFISEELYISKVEKLNEGVEKKRKKLEHDAAVRERESAVFAILLNTAMGVMSVWAQYAAAPPVAALMSALVTALGVSQIAALPPVPQYAKGNYMNVVGRDDGRTYNARVIDNHSSGFFSDPTFIKGLGLVGDTPKKELVFNPVDTQKIIDNDYLLSAINETLDVPQFADGNADTIINDSTTQNQYYSDPILIQAITRLNSILENPLIATLLANEDYVIAHQKIVTEVDDLYSEVNQ